MAWDELGTVFDAYVSIELMGLFQIAPSTDVIIDEQNALLEFNDELPHTVTTIRRLH